MSKFTAQDYFIAINGTALSDHANSISVESTADQVDFTTFSPNAYKQTGQGMKDATIACTFFSDFAASSIHTILQPLYDSGGTFSVEVRPTSAARSSTNPAALLTGRLFNYNGIAGKVGDAATMDVTIQNAGTAGLTWATA